MSKSWSSLSSKNVDKDFGECTLCVPNGGGPPLESDTGTWYLPQIFPKLSVGNNFFVFLCTRRSGGIGIPIDYFQKLRKKLTDNSQ